MASESTPVGHKRLAPDEQAVERAAEELAGQVVVRWRDASEGVRTIYRDKARAILAAALEQPGACLCACGCGRSLEGRRHDARYALPACRTRACRRKRYTSVTRRGGPSGLQVSYAKAVRVLIAEYQGLNLPDYEARAVQLVRGLLSARQQARLDERGMG